ncbi:MAG TPA: polysaccharide deacetylase family protein [Candidatus Polarisedimenticolaceae bacterium]|nr:polysaccharide deacetylase family protein [Candidatus Polarisedimenticolaceae bacterium]
MRGRSTAVGESKGSVVLRSRFVRFSLGLHVLAALVLLVSLRPWREVVAVVLIDHLVLVGASLWPRSSLVGPNLCRLPSDAEANAVGLTFDDGPDPEVTPAVLEMLDRHRVAATFFCIGRRAARHPELVAEIARRGHRVENHSYRHVQWFCFLGPAALRREIDRAQDALGRQAGAAPRYFRAPAGLRSPWLDPVLVSRGLELVSWSRRGFDTVTRDADRVVRRLLRRVAPGDILVLHDGSSARDRHGRPVVLSTLRALLVELEHRGLRAVAVPPAARR